VRGGGSGPQGAEGRRGQKAAALQFTPELVAQGVGLLPPHGQPGGTIQASYSVKNEGLVAAGPFTTRFYLSPDGVKSAGDKRLEGAHAASGVAAGGGLSAGGIVVTVPTAVAPGSYHVIACVDDPNKIAEGNETDNCVASPGPSILIERPNLVVQAVGAPGAAVAPGGNLLVTDTTKNTGGIATLSASTTRYYLSTNQTKGSGDKLLTGGRTVPVLDAGASSQGTAGVGVPSSTAPGPYYLLACADDSKGLAETSETDNCAASASPVQGGVPTSSSIPSRTRPARWAPGGASA